MVLVDSHGVPRVPCYSGAKTTSHFRLQDYHFLWYIFPNISPGAFFLIKDVFYLLNNFLSHNPKVKILILFRHFLGPVSFATTPGIDFSSFSSRY